MANIDSKYDSFIDCAKNSIKRIFQNDFFREYSIQKIIQKPFFPENSIQKFEFGFI